MKLRKLTARQRFFAHEVVKNGFNAGAAYREVYPEASRATSETNGPRLLRKPHVAALVAKLQGVQLAKVDASAQRVKDELARLAFVDATQACKRDGSLLPLHDMPEDVRRAVSGFEIAGKARKVRKVRFWSKPEALGLLAKHHGLLREIIEVSDVTETRDISDDEWAVLSRLEHEVRGG